MAETISGKRERPAPRVTPQTAAYWKAASEGRLLLGTCGDCGKICHPPQAVCPFCWSSSVGTKPASGQGRLNAFTIIHQSAIPAFRERIPYVVAYVELDEGLYMNSNVVNCDPSAVKIGMPLKATFERIGDGVGVTLFEPA
jgi:uncharacterized OB-fold protein